MNFILSIISFNKYSKDSLIFFPVFDDPKNPLSNSFSLANFLISSS